MESKTMSSTKAQIRANNKYNKNNTTQINIRLNNVIDKELIDHLKAQTNLRQYIMNLVYKDIREHSTSLKAYARFENEQTGDEGYSEVNVMADLNNAVDVAADVYDNLPEFIKDQVSVLGVTDGDLDIDVLEVSIGRGLLNK